MLQKKLIIAALVFVGFAGVAHADGNGLNLGVIVGSDTGLSFKAPIGNDRAIDGGLAYSSDNKYGTTFHLDYLFDKARQFNTELASPLNLYYGIGFKLQNIRTGEDSGKTRLGVRAPIGISYNITNPDLEFFGELAPILEVVPGTGVYVDAGIGVRYRF